MIRRQALRESAACADGRKGAMIPRMDRRGLWYGK